MMRMVMRRHRGTLVAGVGLAVMVVLTGLVRAADEAAVTDVSEIAKYLGAVYKDENGGFRLCPPAGAHVASRAGLELMSFDIGSKQWVGDLQTVRLKQDISVEEYLKTSASELSKTFRAVQVLDSREVVFQKHKAGRLTLSFEGDVGGAQGGQTAGARERIALLRQQLMIQFAGNEFTVLTFYTPLKDQEEAMRTFEAMLTTLEFLDKKKLEEHRLQAARAGKKWLAARSADELKNKLIAQPQLFRIRIDTTDVGYIRFDESEVTRDGTTGILVTVNSRSFPSDGTVVLGQNEAYWAYSKGSEASVDRLHYSMWMNSSKTDKMVPDSKRRGEMTPYTFWLSEMGTLQMDKSTRLSASEIEVLRRQREEMLKDPKLDQSRIPPAIEDPAKSYRLVVSRQGDPTQGLTDRSLLAGASLAASNKSINVSIPDNRPSPLPKVLEYVWPRVVDLTQPSEMSFLVYNSSAGKLSLRTLSVIGPDRIAIEGKTTDCCKLTDELEQGSTTLWVDKSGKILTMKTSDQSLLLPTTEERMQQLWGKKLERLKQP